nr:MAG TPA: hypothetical protein [Caudoviricetes sp.]
MRWCKVWKGLNLPIPLSVHRITAYKSVMYAR